MLVAVALVGLIGQFGMIASVAVVDSGCAPVQVRQQPRVDAYPRLTPPTHPPIAQTLGAG
jgi:hypothetical protein